jgi:hypothetical protein
MKYEILRLERALKTQDTDTSRLVLAVGVQLHCCIGIGHDRLERALKTQDTDTSRLVLAVGVQLHCWIGIDHDRVEK